MGKSSDKTKQAREVLLRQIASDPVLSVLNGHLVTREVALLFQASPRTVADWARKGRLPYVRGPGGHYLYPVEEVRRLLVETGRLSALDQ